MTHNTRMWENRANPVKQGVIASVEDLRVSRAQDDIDDHDYSAPIDTDFVLHPVEGPRFIQLIVERTSAYNERLGKAAELWLSGLYSEVHEPGSPRSTRSPKLWTSAAPPPGPTSPDQGVRDPGRQRAFAITEDDL
jgi:hypothetical protein